MTRAGSPSRCWVRLCVPTLGSRDSHRDLLYSNRVLQRVRAWQTVGVLALVALPLAAAETALDRYVKKPDPTYKYELVRTMPGQGYTTYIIDLTSQTWRTAAEVDHPVWKHWLTIVRPDQVSGNIGYLFITGGSVTA